MALTDIHETLYDEAQLWLDGGCNLELNVAGTWLAVERFYSDSEGIVKCDTPSGTLWFALEELKGIRTIREQGEAEPSSWLPS